MLKASCTIPDSGVNVKILPYAEGARSHILAAQKSAIRGSYETPIDSHADHNRFKRIAGALSLLAEAIEPLTAPKHSEYTTPAGEQVSR